VIFLEMTICWCCGLFRSKLEHIHYFPCRAHRGYQCNQDSFNKKGRISLWLESDSHFVTLAFKNSGLVPRRLRNRWLNCVKLTKNMHFIVSHIFREDNRCTDKIVYIMILFDGILSPLVFHNYFLPLIFYIRKILPFRLWRIALKTQK
jgi:hypothetical protein